MLTDRADAQLVGLLMPAMLRGEPITVEGAVSERLLHHLRGPLQSVYRRIDGRLRRVAIECAEVTPDHLGGNGVAMGFSAGIDSFCSMADYHYGDPLPTFRVSHLLFNNVGSHGRGERADRLFRLRYERVRRLPAAVGLPMVPLDSNLDSFYDHFDYVSSHSPRNASAALLLQGGLRRFLYSSGQSYSGVFVKPTKTLAAGDPITVPMLGTESLEAHLVGSEYTRIEKTAKVMEVADSWWSLDVCAGGTRGEEGNCSRCWKCMGTMFTLELLGGLDRYCEVFDLDSYRGQLRSFLARALRSHDPLEREMIEYGRKRGYSFPLSSRLRSLPAVSKGRRGALWLLRWPGRFWRDVLRKTSG